MQERRRHRRETRGAERDEGDFRPDEAVEAVRGVDRAEQRDRTRRRDDGRDVRPTRRDGRCAAKPTPQRFAASDQRGRDRKGGQHPQARPEHALLDRVAHEQDRAEGERDAADPNDPARAEAFLEGRPRLRLCRRDRLRPHGRHGGRFRRRFLGRSRRSGIGDGHGRQLSGRLRRGLGRGRRRRSPGPDRELREPSLELSDALLQQRDPAALAQDQNERERPGQHRNHGRDDDGYEQVVEHGLVSKRQTRELRVFARKGLCARALGKAKEPDWKAGLVFAIMPVGTDAARITFEAASARSAGCARSRR